MMNIVDTKTQMENEHRVAEEYLSSLSDLNCNSKPLINMLTMLAEENIEYAPVIVKVVEQHISKVPPDFKLPILYLIDSIIKNVKSTYVQLFSQCIVNIFCGVFEQVNEKIRERMYALRQTWNEVFSTQKLYTLDVKTKQLDNNWPITARPSSIHVNPDFLKTVGAGQSISTGVEEILQHKTRELLELKKRKLELELEATKKHLEEQEKQLSKTTDGVIQPVEGMVSSSALQKPSIGNPQMPPRIIPNLMAPGYMPPAQMNTTVHNVRPGMFSNMRSFRPNMHPNMMNMQQGMGHSAINSGLNVAANMNTNNGNNNNNNNNNSNSSNKPKVHPVSSSLLNMSRQRDPRLARHQQQQIQKHFSEEKKNNFDQRSITNNKDNSSPRQQSDDSHDHSVGRSGKHSSVDNEKSRKRNESKSSTSTTSSTANNSDERKRSSGSKKDQSKGTTASDCDKDAFEIAPLGSAFKRKSSSPTISPKSNDRSRYNSHKSRTYSRNKKHSRSPSPRKDPKDALIKEDIANRSSSPTLTTPEKRFKGMPASSNNMNNNADVKATSTDLDKNEIPLTKSSVLMSAYNMDVDLRPQLILSTTTASNANILAIDSKFNINSGHKLLATVDSSVPTTSANTVAISSTKVSFRIKKINNKLEKSSENLTAKSSLTATTAKIPQLNNSKMDVDVDADVDSNLNMDVDIVAQNVHSVDRKIDGIYNSADQVSRDDDDADNGDGDEHKKRISVAINDEEQPTAKKTKSSKLDTLFGSEDVDLRKLMPTLMVNCDNSKETTPPPPPITTSSHDVTKRNDSWNLLKSDGVNNNNNNSNSNNSNISSKKSTLDDVRAKLAKTAKLSKLSKTEKTTKEFSQRLRLVELQSMNEDTQEANDEKIRTMIAQAQELLEAKSISQEQYSNLLKTVMSINEVNKLKIAKRRESLNAIKKKLDEEDINDVERNAAREAVLKKRIPKLSKTQNTSNETGSALAGHNESCNATATDGSPRCDDDSIAESMTRTRNNRDKRSHRISKWSERVLDTPLNNVKLTGPSPRAWNPMASSNVRGFCGNPSASATAPARLPTNPTHLPLQWQMGGGNSNALPPFPNNSIQTIRKMLLPPIPAQKPVIPKPCNSIDNPQEDLVRSITIDGTAKEIRFYDQVAIVFMEADQPREIGFQNGQRNIYIDNHEPILLQFNDDYKAFVIGGETFRLRFGFPSRELYIDEHWYEIYFGGPPITVPVRNQLHMLKAEGPPPQVNIGPLRRDLVAGKINMIIDAHNVIPLYLDARIQTFLLGGKEHSIQFADNLLTVLLDNKPIRVEYGGLPRSLFLGGKKYFVRFGALPRDVIIGKVQIKDMIYVETQPPASNELEFSIANMNKTCELPLTADVGQKELIKSTEPSASFQQPSSSTTLSSTINIDDLFQKLVSSGILKSSGSTLPVINKPPETELSNQPPNENTTTTTSSVADEVEPLPQEEAIRTIDLTKSESVKTRQSAIVATLYSGMQCSSCGVRFPPEQTIKYSQHLDWHFRQNRRERDSTRKAHSRKWYYDLNDWVQYEEIEDLEEREKNFFEAQQNDLDNIDDASNQRSTNSPIPNCPAKPDDVDRACDMCHEKFEQFYNEEHEEWYLRCAIRVTDKIYHPLCYEDYKASLNPPKLTEEKSEKKTSENDGQLCIQLDDDNAVDIQIKTDVNSDQNTDKTTATVDECCDEDDDDVIVLPNEEPLITEIDDDDDDDDGGGGGGGGAGGGAGDGAGTGAGGTGGKDNEDEYIPVNVTREEMGNSQETAEENNVTEKTAEKEIMESSDIEIQEPHIPFTDLDTYVEKENTKDANTNSDMMAFMNVKIKEEPKEDDEDDDFEDVGTVLIAPEDISISSYGDNQTTAINNAIDCDESLSVERLTAPNASPNSCSQNESNLVVEAASTDLNINMDGNLETADEHNLSVASLAPTVPLATLVNKIKININKNTISTTSSSINTSNTTNNAPNTSNLPITTTVHNNSNSNLINLKDNQRIKQSSTLTTISTIPVLCGGVTTDPTIVSTVIDENRLTNANNVGTLPVTGDYKNESAHSTQLPKVSTASQQTNHINYELKPALQKVNLKKQDKVSCGTETSGLCSIM